MTQVTDVLRVLVADDHAPTRAGVRQALEADGCVVVAEVPDGRRAVEAALALVPDVCLLDINMPGEGGVAAARAISDALPGMPIVMLTASRDDDDLFDALRAGASGYLLKDMDPDRLAAALRGALAGESAMPRALAARVVAQFRSTSTRRLSLRGKPGREQLTDREAEVLDLLAHGLSTEDIAARMFVSQVTVRTHVRNVLKKLRVPDREAAVRLARSQKD
jgi:two-component system NarL family response regulator